MAQEQGKEQPRSGRETDARFFLANERTFLSWIRTSVAVIAVGFVVSKFTLFLDEVAAVTNIHLPHPGRESVYLGAVLTALGGVLILLATVRFLRNREALMHDNFRPAVTLDVLLSLSMILAALILTVYLVRSV